VLFGDVTCSTRKGKTASNSGRKTSRIRPVIHGLEFAGLPVQVSLNACVFCECQRVWPPVDRPGIPVLDRRFFVICDGWFVSAQEEEY
jgi:hypothetical protein